MRIVDSYFPPDDTYIRVGDIEPEISGTNLLMTAGRGTRRSWGAPGADYEIILDALNLVSVVIWWTSKHAGGQAWRHYRNTTGGWRRATWAQLPDCERQVILAAYQQRRSVFDWLRAPGKLASQRAKPRQHEQLERDEQGALIGYKYLDVLATADGQQYFRSPRAVQLWENDELTSDQIPTENNTNGIYAMKTPNSPELTFYRADCRRLVRLLLSGVVIEGQYGLRAEHAYILEVYDADR